MATHFAELMNLRNDKLFFKTNNNRTYAMIKKIKQITIELTR